MKVSDIEVSYVDHMGTDLSVVNAARVSFAKESQCIELKAICVDPYSGDEYTKTIRVLNEADRRLINYLAKHKHYSPFNHTFLTFRIKAPIFVARQLVKHEYMPWNEVSRRYVDDEPEFYLPPHWRAKAENVKQGSADTEVDLAYLEVASPSALVNEALRTYKGLLELGVCAEQARMILPQNTMTEWIWSGTLKAFHKMLVLRLDPHTQYESRIVAEKIAPVIEDLFPVSFPALMKNP